MTHTTDVKKERTEKSNVKSARKEKGEDISNVPAGDERTTGRKKQMGCIKDCLSIYTEMKNNSLDLFPAQN